MISRCSGLEVAAKAAFNPETRPSTASSTATVMAIPAAVMMVVVFRITRFRTLYETGIAICVCLSGVAQRIENIGARRVPGRDEGANDSDQYRDRQGNRGRAGSYRQVMKLGHKSRGSPANNQGQTGCQGQANEPANERDTDGLAHNHPQNGIVGKPESFQHANLFDPFP